MTGVGCNVGCNVCKDSVEVYTNPVLEKSTQPATRNVPLLLRVRAYQLLIGDTDRNHVSPPIVLYVYYT